MGDLGAGESQGTSLTQAIPLGGVPNPIIMSSIPRSQWANPQVPTAEETFNPEPENRFAPHATNEWKEIPGNPPQRLSNRRSPRHWYNLRNTSRRVPNQGNSNQEARPAQEGSVNSPPDDLDEVEPSEEGREEERRKLS